jgi:hypothetical protein
VIGTSAKATMAVLAVGGLLSAGLSACSPAPAPLACAAQPSSTAPGPNTTEIISIRTMPGAKVLTVATYLSAKPIRIATANDAGIARVLYPVGTAAPGYPVKVTVAVAKNGANGNCSTAFTPKRVGSTAPLTAALSYHYVVPRPLPSDPSVCTSLRPGQSGCGAVIITALISGFSAHGGIPACPTGNPVGCANQDGAALRGQLSLAWTISCPADQTSSTRNDVPVSLGPGYQSNSPKVTPYTRVDNDTAKLSVVADLPFGPEMANCPSGARLDSLSASNVTLQLIGGGYPTSNFSAPGPFISTPATTSMPG